MGPGRPSPRRRSGSAGSTRSGAAASCCPGWPSCASELAGLDHVVLAGMGGSSLAPEVIARTLGVRLTVLDTTDPHQVRAALADRLDRTVVVVSSKSGSTVETDSHRRAYWQAFADAGLSRRRAARFVIVTDPGSPLEPTAREMGAHVVLADPDVGGRYSALTAFGLVPTALAGVDVAELLDQAEEFGQQPRPRGRRQPGAGPRRRARARPRTAGRDKVALVDDGTGITGLGDWAEQLIAESTGKQGTGILPVVVETPAAPGATGDDVLTVTSAARCRRRESPAAGSTARVRSTARSARSSWPGRRRPRWPDGCSASTRSTSPT